MSSVVQQSIGTCGLTGLDRLLCFMMVRELQHFLAIIERGVLRDKMWLEMFGTLMKTLNPVRGLISELKITRAMSVHPEDEHGAVPILFNVFDQ